MPGNTCRFEMPMGEVEQLIAHFAFLAQLGDETAGDVLGHLSPASFNTALGGGLSSRLLLPCSVRSSASSTRRGRMWFGTLMLIDTPCRLVGRLRLTIFALAATEFGTTARCRAGEQVRGAPVDVEHLAFDAVDHHQSST
jgi:hypothetical protein